jgi:hypothetical protein
MTRRVRVEEVIAWLGPEGREVLAELRREGLFEQEELEAADLEDLRVAACLMRDLGVNPAGVEVILHMRRRLFVLERLMSDTVRRLLDESEPR